MLADYLANEIFGMIFLSGYRIVEEKKRYEKLNDAAYSALKYRDCAANVFFKLSIMTSPWFMAVFNDAVLMTFIGS